MSALVPSAARAGGSRTRARIDGTVRGRVSNSDLAQARGDHASARDAVFAEVEMVRDLVQRSWRNGGCSRSRR